MCRNGDPFWPGAYEGGRLDKALLVQHFIEEKFGLRVDAGRASELVESLASGGVEMSEPATRRHLALALGVGDCSGAASDAAPKPPSAGES